MIPISRRLLQRSYAALMARPVGQFCCWYLALLIPTVGFKLQSLTVGHDRLATVLAVPGASGHLIPAVYHLFRPDVLEVLLMTVLLYVVGHRVLRVPLSILLVGSLTLTLALEAMNYFAMGQVHRFADPDLIEDAWDWVSGHFEIVGNFVTRRNVLGLGLGIVWCLAWLMLVRRFERPPVPRFQATTTASAALLAAAALVGPGAALPGVTAPDAPNRGYWSATLRSLLAIDLADPRGHASASRAEALSRYRAVAYPYGRPPAGRSFLDSILPARVPRHIVIVLLETAPKKYYPIPEDSAFPEFQSLARHALVSPRHYATSLYSSRAISSVITGTYVKPGRHLIEYGDFTSDGLGTILRRAGYETTYIDSYRIDWSPRIRQREVLKDLGFEHLLDADDLGSAPRTAGPLKRTEQLERAAFQGAAAAVTGANARGRKALVVLATTIGHFDWSGVAGDQDLPAARRVRGIARFLDGEVRCLVDRLENAGLRDSLMLVIVGDHGLRYAGEFEALHEPMQHSDVGFNVPFLLYAPGLFSRQMRVPWATSHVDIAPTLLQLSGFNTDTLLLQGESMLDPRLADRVTFLMSNGLTSLDGFLYRGQFIVVDRTNGRVWNAAGNKAQVDLPWSPFEVLDRADKSFLAAAGFFLRLGAADTPVTASEVHP